MSKTHGAGEEITRTYLVTIGVDRDGQGFEIREPLPRCSECRHHGSTLCGVPLKRVLTCDLRPNLKHITEPDGFCHLGQFGGKS